VIEKYPESQLAKDAQASINNLGKSVEELVREFEKNQAASAKK
jgi:outer membrane protein assembly factor BamD (BamD/ComL family)